MIANLINKALTDNDAYMLFIAYGSDTEYNGKKWKFTEDVCTGNFTNNPGWGYYATCDISLGPDGKKGMSLLTRPDSEGSESAGWADHPTTYNGTNIIAWDVMSSSNWGFAKLHRHGDQGWTRVNSEFFTGMSNKQPGLFQLPVCVITDLVW